MKAVSSLLELLLNEIFFKEKTEKKKKKKQEIQATSLH